MALTPWTSFGLVTDAAKRLYWCPRCLTRYQGASAEVGVCTVCGATVTIPTDRT
jgi:hypothetical protein